MMMSQAELEERIHKLFAFEDSLFELAGNMKMEGGDMMNVSLHVMQVITLRALDSYPGQTDKDEVLQELRIQFERLMKVLWDHANSSGSTSSNKSRPLRME